MVESIHTEPKSLAEEALLREDLPPINAFVSGEWTAYRRNAPLAPEWTVRFGVTVAFPQWRPW